MQPLSSVPLESDFLYPADFSQPAWRNQSLPEKLQKVVRKILSLLREVLPQGLYHLSLQEDGEVLLLVWSENRPETSAYAVPRLTLTLRVEREEFDLSTRLTAIEEEEQKTGRWNWQAREQLTTGSSCHSWEKEDLLLNVHFTRREEGSSSHFLEYYDLEELERLRQQISFLLA